MKKILAILLVVVMSLSMITPVFAGSYTDTANNDYEAAIEYLSGLGVIDGMGDGTFAPDAIVTRAQMAKLLVVCLGLDMGASLLEGESSFADVPTNHWATGYIAVAVQYGLIKGDGDGNFRPDDTVNYAEAATMCLRALGYNRVVDKAGQWPTNYLNKANELKIFDDVEAFKGTSSATRGTVAQIMWNMINTKMWEVGEESESDGLTFKAGQTMLNAKFDNFLFCEDSVLKNYAVTNDGEDFNVTLNLNYEYWNGTSIVKDNDDFEYDGNDFFMFPKEITVNALINTKDKSIVAMYISDNQFLAMGTSKELTEKYDNAALDVDTTYAVIALEKDSKGSDIKQYEIPGTPGTPSTMENVADLEFKGITDTKVVVDITEGTKTTKIEYYKATGMNNDSAISFKNDDTEDILGKGLYIINGERATIADLKIGDVITKVATDLYVVSRETVRGTFDSISSSTVVDNAYAEITIGGKDYDFTTAYAFAGNTINVNDFVVELNKNDEEVAVKWDDFINEDEDDNKYLGEDATVYFNAFGDAVKVLFGEVKDVAKKGSLYLISTGKTWDDSDSEGSTTYIKLANTDSEKSYAFDDTAAGVGAKGELNGKAGQFAYVEFEDGKISYAKLVTGITESDGTDTNATVEAGEEATGITAQINTLKNSDSTKDIYDKIEKAGEAINKDTGYYSNYKVTESTTVLKIKQSKDKDDNFETKYTIEASKGAEELKDVTEAIYLLEDGETVKISCVIILGESQSDNQYGIVTKITTKGDTTKYVINDSEEFEVKTSTTANVGNAIIYTLSEGKLTVKAVYEADDLENESTIEVIDVNDELITVDETITPNIYTVYDLALIANEKESNSIDFKGYKAIKATADYDKNDIAYFDTLEEVDLDAITVKKGNAFMVDTTNKLIIVVSGYDR